MALELDWRAHDVAQFLQICRREVEIVAVAALHVLVDAVQVEAERFQKLHRVDSAGGTGRWHARRAWSDAASVQSIVDVELIALFVGRLVSRSFSFRRRLNDLFRKQNARNGLVVRHPGLQFLFGSVLAAGRRMSGDDRHRCSVLRNENASRTTLLSDWLKVDEMRMNVWRAVESFDTWEVASSVEVSTVVVAAVVSSFSSDSMTRTSLSESSEKSSSKTSLLRLRPWRCNCSGSWWPSLWEPEDNLAMLAAVTSLSRCRMMASTASHSDMVVS